MSTMRIFAERNNYLGGSVRRFGRVRGNEKDVKVDRRRDGKTKLRNRRIWLAQLGQLKTELCGKGLL